MAIGVPPIKSHGWLEQRHEKKENTVEKYKKKPDPSTVNFSSFSEALA